MAQINARPFKLALLQLSSLTASKNNNIDVARKAIQAALKATNPPPDLIVLPEIWNSPYAVTKFREYAETVPEVGSTGQEGEGKEGETVKAMREMAKEAGVWLIGGMSPLLQRLGEDEVNVCSWSYCRIDTRAGSFNRCRVQLRHGLRPTR